MSIALQHHAQVGRAAVLPDDRPVDGFASGPIPDYHGFALIGDADTGDSDRANAALCDGVPGGGQHVLPYVLGIMFDPAGLRVMLGKFSLCSRDRARFRIEHDGTGRGGALIDREDVPGC